MSQLDSPWRGGAGSTAGPRTWQTPPPARVRSLLVFHLAVSLTGGVLGGTWLVAGNVSMAGWTTAGLAMSLVLGAWIGVTSLRSRYRPGAAVGLALPLVCAAIAASLLASGSTDRWGEHLYIILWLVLLAFPVADALLLVPLAAPVLLEGHYAAGRRRIALIRRALKARLIGWLLGAVLVVLAGAGGFDDETTAEWALAATLMLTAGGLVIAILGWLASAWSAVLVGVVLPLVSWSAAWMFAGSDSDSLAILWVLSMSVALPLADSWLLATLGRKARHRPASSLADTPPHRSPAVLAEAVRDCLMAHEPFRFRNRFLRLVLVYLPFRCPFTIPFMPFLIAGAVNIGIQGGVDGTDGESYAQVFLVTLPLWIGTALLVKEYERGLFGTQRASRYIAETRLVERVETGLPFGLYLHPFDLSERESTPVDRLLNRSETCPFFALDDVRRNTPVLQVPEIWVPARDWQRIALPLIQQAAVVVVDLAGTPRHPDGHAGLRDELAYIVQHDLTGKTILIVRSPSEGITAHPPSDIDWSWDREIALLAGSFPERLRVDDVDALLDRVAALGSSRELHPT